MSDIAIRAENLGKSYQITHNIRSGYKTLQEDMLRLLKNPFTKPGDSAARETFWALKDVSFEVKYGEVLGIIGRNGAGKSTLLKILSRITKPTTGHADIYGRIGSLLEVGTGFHPELTGRENIFLNGAVLGMTRRDIQRHFDEIVAFAEVEQFLDTPVKRYSSGMYMRLAFAVAAHLEPEVLVVDEVLAVGDAEFQKKCLGKMSDVAKSGRTVLFVSHNMGAIQSLCPTCIWLSNGKIADYGRTREIIPQYLSTDNSSSEWCASDRESVLTSPYFNPTHLYIVDADLRQISREISADETVGIVIEGLVEKQNVALTVGFALYNGNDELLFWSLHTDVAQEQWPQVTLGLNRLVAWLPPHVLNEGDYRVELILSLHYQQWMSQPGKNAPAINFAIRGGLSDSPYWMAARPGLLAPILPFETLKD